MKETKIRKNQKGITLIALVITIIVLLILAGVAISMLSGENGILKQAAKAKTETDKKTVEEQVKLAAMDALMRGNELTSIDSKEDIEDALKSQGLNNAIVTEAEDASLPYPYTIKVNEKTYKVSTKGEVEEKPIVKTIKSTNYGDYITGYKDLTDIEGTDNDWQVFYNDGENVWIIASDYVQIDEGTAGMTKSEYNVCWPSGEYPDLGETYINGNCAKALKTISNWNAYLDEDLATKAWGGPTIEMFANSYNAKYKDKIGKSIKIDLVTTDDNKGYQVKWSTDSSFGEYIEGVTDTASNGMYIKTEEVDKPNGYWLASPSAHGYNHMLAVFFDSASSGSVDFMSSARRIGVGIRPVVCLKAELQVKKVDGIWEIHK